MPSSFSSFGRWNIWRAFATSADGTACDAACCCDADWDVTLARIFDESSEMRSDR